MWLNLDEECCKRSEEDVTAKGTDRAASTAQENDYGWCCLR